MIYIMTILLDMGYKNNILILTINSKGGKYG